MAFAEFTYHSKQQCTLHNHMYCMTSGMEPAGHAVSDTCNRQVEVVHAFAVAVRSCSAFCTADHSAQVVVITANTFIK